jgi:cellulose synthase (UDP-forming)
VSFYFDRFEDRKPPEPMPHSPVRELLFQTVAVAAAALGVWYLGWRWSASLNWKAWWIAIPLVTAETLSFAGTLLFFCSIWRNKDVPQKEVPTTVNDISREAQAEDRPIAVDVFFPTYNEDIELVRLSIRDAKKMTYPHPIDVRIYALDDGKRPEMRAVAEEEGVGYITRTNNAGYKAGNLRNAMENTEGDLIVICDADTRPFPELLRETLGYFRDPDVAWVQTPQWFYDLDEGTPLPKWLAERCHLGIVGSLLGRAIERVVGKLPVGADPLGNDPAMFYDIIQRRRNWANASFCCGAGSVHRREAVTEAALKAFSDQVTESVDRYASQVDDPAIRGALAGAMTAEVARETEVTPYKFHVSEDIYTSIVLHSDAERKWQSVYHPRVCSKMLSPQDLLTWSIQRFKYAGGTLDIFAHDNPLKRKSLTAWQKVMYGTTIFSYFAPLWTVVFLCAPLVYLFTGASAVSAYDDAFYAHLLPFLVLNKLAFVLGTWGVETWRGEQHYLGFFWLNLKALRDVVLSRPIKFHVTPKTRQSGNFYGLVWPHLVIIGLSLLGLALMGVRVFGLHQAEPGAYLANLFWTIANMLSLSAIVFAARRRPQEAS